MAKFTCNFISYILKRAVDITVVIPSTTIPEALRMEQDEKIPKKMHTKQEKYPVLYLLHGMGNNHSTWGGYSNVEMYAEERNLAVVMISGENKSYINSSDGDRYFDFIEDELPDFICGMFPVSSKREDTYIAGLSMGGYGALVHGLSHPEKYAAVGAFSAPIDMMTSLLDKTGNWKKYDPRFLVENLVEKGSKLPQLYLACGEKDQFFEDCKRFAVYLKEKEVEAEWVSFPEYKHEWRFWNMILEKYMDYIPRTDSYYQETKIRQI